MNEKQPTDVEKLAHRIAWRYKKSSDPTHSDTYTFNRDTLLQFADALIATERQDAWDAVNKWIKTGDLGGNGWDMNAQRNGMVLATNVLMGRIGDA